MVQIKWHGPLAKEPPPGWLNYLVVFEQCDCNLEEYIHVRKAEGKLLSVEHFLHMASQLCSALTDMHRMSIIHRDIAPRNILIKSHGDWPECKICDFGISKRVSSKTNSVLFYFPTTGNVHPALVQSSAQAHGPEVDLYGLGIVFLQLALMDLDCVSPLQALREAQIAKALDTVATRYNKDVASLIQAMVTCKLEAKSCSELCSDLEQARDFRDCL